MSELESKLQHLRKRAGMALCLNGVSWIVIAVLAVVTLLGLFDWWLQLESDGLRMCFGLGVLIGAGVLAWRLLFEPLRNRLSDLALALRIERRYPGFKDGLASTVQFAAGHADPNIGSPELQQKVIAETLADLQSVRLDDVIETRRVRRITWFAVATCLLVALLAGLRPAEASLALSRLIFPFSAADWPRKHELQLLDRDLRPLTETKFRRVRGDTFKFYVEDRKGTLPDDVTLVLRYGDGESRTETLRRVTIRDENGTLRSLCVANVLLERGPIHFRVVGGDDDTLPQSRIDVVPPPQIDDLDVELVPPQYANRAPQRLPHGIGHFEALPGTLVRIKAGSNKALQTARLRVKNRTATGTRLSRDGREITAEFRIVETGNYSYRFELQDREGFQNPHAPGYDVKAVADRVPVVRLVKPADNVRATAIAAVNLEYIVEDDLGIRDVVLKYAYDRDPKGRFRTIALLKPTEKSRKKAAAEPLREFSRSFRWPLKDVAPGTQIRFFIEATDAFNLDAEGRPDPMAAPHAGRSQVRTITIVTPADKLADVAGRYNELLEDLTRVERLQRRAHAQLGQLRVQLDNAGKLRPNEDLALLRRIVQDQHDVRHQLADGDQSIQNRAQQSLADIRVNHLNASRLQRRLKRIVDELRAIQPELKTAISDLRFVETASRPAAGGKAAPEAKSPAERRERLIAAESKQADILQSLRDLIGELTEWRNWHNLSGDLRELIRDQKEIHTEAARLQPRTLGKPLAELAPQEKADLARLAEQQRRASDRLERFRKSLRKFRDHLKQPDGDDRTARETLGDADSVIGDRELIPRMRSAAGQIEANRLGEMPGVQKKLSEDLQTLLSVLENRSTGDLKTLLKRQRQAEADLADLFNRQQELADQLRKLGDNPPAAERDRLAAEQETLRKKAEQMVRTLRRQSAPQASRTLQRAAKSMDRAADALRNGLKQEARAAQQDAADSLQQARRELARTRRQTEAQLAAQMLERLAGDIRAILRRQNSVIKETNRLKSLVETAQKDRGKPWTRGRLITLDTQREEQDRLAGRLRELAESSRHAAILALSLETAGKEMSAAVKSLASARKDVSQLDAALRREQSAKRQLEQLLKSLTPESRPGTTPPPSGNGGGEEGTKVAGPQVTAQLKLVKAMQDQLAGDTRAFDNRRKPGVELAPQQQTELDRLTGRQEKLRDLSSDLMRNLGIKPQPAAGDDPPKAGKPTQLLRDVVRRMGSTAERLKNAETGKPTQNAQQRISDDLKKLIATAASATGAARTQTAGNDNGQRKGGKEKSQGGNGKTNKKNPQGSDPGVRNPAETRKVILAQRRRMIEEVWGHLPESVKQQLQNMAGENYLPKYKPLIKRYFESLAE